MAPQLLNPFFEDGWTDWEMVRVNGDEDLATVDSIKYGLMTDRPNPVGFPVCGRSYMLLARKLLHDGDASYYSANLNTKSEYALATGDVIDCLVGWGDIKITSGKSCDVYVYFDGTPLASQIIGPTTLAYSRVRLCARVATGSTGKISIYTRTTNMGNTDYVEWLSVDDIRIYPACNHYTPSTANDASGVT